MGWCTRLCGGYTRGYTLGLCGVVYTWIYTGFVWGGAHVCVGGIHVDIHWVCVGGVHVDIHWVCVGWCTRGYTLGLCGGCTRGYTLGLCGVVHTFVWGVYTWIYTGFVWGGVHVDIHWVCVGWCTRLCGGYTRGYTLGLCGGCTRGFTLGLCGVVQTFVWGV